MKIWVDDIRDAPDDTWVIARTFDDAIRLLEGSTWTMVSLDHDLADFTGPNGREQTGYDILLVIIQRMMDGYHVGEVKVHSANVVAVPKMLDMIDKYLITDC